MLNLRRLADGDKPGSFSNRMRDKRFRLFEELVQDLPRPLKILDIGGKNGFWEHRGWADKDFAEILIVNLVAQEQVHSNIKVHVGDATNLREFDDRSFDVVFSNSVIEHLFTLENQAAMAREIRRIGKAHWVQTPNFWFPVEPHFHVPGWHWLPEGLRVAIVRRRRCGWRGPCPDPADARKLVKEVRLMSRRELARLFPDSEICAERFCGLVKSWIVIRRLRGERHTTSSHR
ncbi:MAG: class I SAM-dependent methyltransferase [Planctomycetes bacterium]|nr:class I SAM-dependent methyltransferase [Planctomycetota bacterium]